MSNQKEVLHQHLLSSRTSLLEWLNALTPEQWQTVIFSEENQWTAADILRHLASAQRGMASQITQIQSGGTGVPDDFDLARWNARSVQKTQEKTVSELLAELESGQMQLLSILDTMQDDDWEKKGRHGSGRILSIAEIFHLIGSHESSHAQDIQQALQRNA